MIYKIINLSGNLYDEKLYEKAYNAMTPERQKKADRYKQPSDKRCCVFADMLLREMLRDNYSVAEPDFYIDENQKPHIVGDKIHFSLSHSGDFIACAIDSSPIGIDIEKIRTVELPLIKRVCTDEELSFVLKSEDSTINKDTCVQFLKVWCAKEAYLKYTGQGLKGGLQSISVADENGIKTNPLPHIKLELISTEDYIGAVISEI